MRVGMHSFQHTQQHEVGYHQYSAWCGVLRTELIPLLQFGIIGINLHPSLGCTLVHQVFLGVLRDQLGGHASSPRPRHLEVPLVLHLEQETHVHGAVVIKLLLVAHCEHRHHPLGSLVH